MFTIKYRTYHPSATQNAAAGAPTNYDICEQIHGPFDLVSQEMDDGYKVVYAHRGDSPGMTFGPNKGADVAGDMNPAPRSTLWVMNENGATVATYELYVAHGGGLDYVGAAPLGSSLS